MAPLSRLWGLFLKNREDGNEEKTEYYGLRALWYIRNCLNKNLMTGELI